MKRFYLAMARVTEVLRGLVLSKGAIARRASRESEAGERKAGEAERLDRLRNPGDYRGR